MLFSVTLKELDRFEDYSSGGIGGGGGGGDNPRKSGCVSILNQNIYLFLPRFKPALNSKTTLI